MGKAGKWIRSFLTGKKERVKEKDRAKKEENSSSNQSSSFTAENPRTPIVIPPTTPKEKKRWSFRRSAATGVVTKDLNSMDIIATTLPAMQAMLEAENEQKKHAIAVAAATAAAADAAVAAAHAAAAVIRLTAAAPGRPSTVEETAAIQIQAVFRSYLARKALSALKGLVKLQALIRGHLVRRQATVTLHCMQALVTVQARARARRIRMAEEAQPITRRHSIHGKSPQDNWLREAYNDMDRGMENIKIVEMDLGESRGNSKSRSYSNHPQIERAEHRYSTHYAGHHANSKQDNQLHISPVPSTFTDMSPKACSGYFEECSFTTALSSPEYHSAMSKPDPRRVPFAFPRPEYADSMSHDYPFFPNYMANTESSKAKVRSYSAPRQRPDSYERQTSRRRAAMEGRGVPQVVRMQRSSSHVGSTDHGYQNPWLIKLDRSTISQKDSECGSTSTVLTNTNYCRSLVSYEVSMN
ncbi:hypothetical protein HHK36_022674 [Tetracentron sinense]|uniref:DUF4005 domain-containing protein n=1 Tax=Tetracentron sinense TaxID=13715 RepID=A0A834YV99_TETSI|nr:hypothetical protein HHK36_022674 [Tetracentron sinense]